MPGASEQTRPVKILNANWVPGTDGGDGRFDIMIVTGDDQRHELPAQAGPVMMWDPPNRTLIAANVVGQMPWTVRDGGS